MKRAIVFSLWFILTAIGCNKNSDEILAPAEKNGNEIHKNSLQKVQNDFHLISPSNNGWMCEEVTFTWEQATPNGNVCLYGYEIYLNGSSVHTVVGNTTSWTTTLSQGQSYNWKILAIFRFSPSCASFAYSHFSAEEWTVSIYSPPTNAYVSGYVGGMPSVNWTASSGPVSNYKVYRKGTYTSWSLLGTTTLTYWVDSQVKITTQSGATDYYTYKVTAVYTNGCETGSSNQPGTYGKLWSY